MRVFKSWKSPNGIGRPVFEFNNLGAANVPCILRLFKEVPRTKSPYFKKGTQSRFQIANEINNSKIFPNSILIKSWILGYSANKKKTSLKANLFYDKTFSQLALDCQKSIIFSQLNLDVPILTKLVNKLAKKFKCYVGVNGYFTPKGNKTFPRHFDHHDVFIFQVSGTKSWKVFDYDASEADKLKPIIEVVLEPGDFIFIPAGFYHEARTNKDSSFHLTFGLHDVPIHQLRSWVNQLFPELKNWENKRRSIYSLSLLYYLKRYDVFIKTKTSFSFENKLSKKITIFNSEKQIQIPLSKKKSIEKFYMGSKPANALESKLFKLLEAK